MSTPNRPELLRDLRDRGLAHYARTRAASDERHGEPPSPGEVFAFPETVDAAVFWAVVEEVPGDGGRFLMVAADLAPFVGSADVAVSVGGEGGAWCLRSGTPIRLAEADFTRARRVAFLETEAIDRVLQKRTAATAGKSVGSVLEQETDAEPEYQDWLAELAKARTALAGMRRETVNEVSEAPIAFHPPLGTRTYGNVYALAASILLVVAVGGLVWQRQEISRLEQESQTETVIEPAVNVAFAMLPATGAVRGEPKILTVPSAAVYFLLILETREDYPSYRLEISEEKTHTRVWSLDEMTKVGATELTVLLPRRKLPDGDYRLRLLGRHGVEAELIRGYSLRIKSP